MDGCQILGLGALVSPDAIDTIVTLAQRVAARLLEHGKPAPDAETVARVVTGAFIVRNGTIDYRATAPRGSDDTVRGFIAALRFHRGANMNLHGPVMYTLMLGDAVYTELDNLALGLCVVINGGSRGINTWSRALGGN
jgi:hypothetical protein